jgi:protein TonB
VAPSRRAPVLPPVQVPPAPAPVTAARVDADYLHNPKPVYPVFSRRMNEEGKVQLRVRVSADGAALEVEIRQSSGFPRLDAAAREAVAKWRFVPARRGDDAVESWVGVPIVFKLDT